MFSQRLLLWYINGNKCEKRNMLEENGIWQTTSELITPPPDGHAIFFPY